MKLNYKQQLLLSVVLVLLGNVLCTVFKHWIYRNTAYFICALIWIFHPVMAGSQEPTQKQLNQIRFWCGGLLLLIAFFTRSYFY